MTNTSGEYRSGPLPRPTTQDDDPDGWLDGESGETLCIWLSMAFFWAVSLLIGSAM